MICRIVRSVIAMDCMADEEEIRMELCSSSLKVIGSSAFSSCSKLTSISLPNTVIQLDYQALGIVTKLIDYFVTNVLIIS